MATEGLVKEELGDIFLKVPLTTIKPKCQLEPDGGSGHRSWDPVADVLVTLCILICLGGAGDHTPWMHTHACGGRKTTSGIIPQELLFLRQAHWLGTCLGG